MNRLALTHLVLLGSLIPLACDKGDSETSTDSETGSNESDSSDSNGSETGSTGSSSETGSETSTDTGDPVMCPEVFPTFDETCQMDSDCAVVLHTTDCCGTEVAWGIAAAEVAAFESAEAICDSQYPGCGCAPSPTLAEDGNTVMDPSLLAVSCQMGACTSYVLMP